MENLEFLQDNTLLHAILLETLLTKVGQQLSETAIRSYLLLTYFPRYKFPPKPCAVRNYLASCPSLVYLAGKHCIYKSNVHFLIKKMSFELYIVKKKLWSYQGQPKQLSIYVWIHFTNKTGTNKEANSKWLSLGF